MTGFFLGGGGFKGQFPLTFSIGKGDHTPLSKMRAFTSRAHLFVAVCISTINLRIRVQTGRAIIYK